MIICEKCGKAFGYQKNLEEHQFASSNCQLTTIDASKFKMPTSYSCHLCGKTYTTIGNLNRHISKCSVYTKPYKQKNTKSISIGGNLTIKNINNNNITQNIQNIQNIIMARPGKENIDHITKDIFLALLSCKSFPEMSLKLLETFYFNVKVPQNCNWCLVYPKNKEGGVELDEESKKFERTNTEELINKRFLNMINLCFPLIDEIYQQNKATPFLTNRQFLNLLKCYGYVEQEKIQVEDTQIYESIKNYAYKNRKIAMNEWKKQGYKGNHLCLKF